MFPLLDSKLLEKGTVFTFISKPPWQPKGALASQETMKVMQLGCVCPSHNRSNVATFDSKTCSKRFFIFPT